jgi:hypothetical protein
MNNNQPTTNDYILIAAGKLQAADALHQLITGTNELQTFRTWLRTDANWPVLTPAQNEHRAGLLDQTCRRLIAAGIGSETYYVGVGDTLPTNTPDNLSDIDPDNIAALDPDTELGYDATLDHRNTLGENPPDQT